MRPWTGVSGGGGVFRAPFSSKTFQTPLDTGPDQVQVQVQVQGCLLFNRHSRRRAERGGGYLTRILAAQGIGGESRQLFGTDLL